MHNFKTFLFMNILLWNHAYANANAFALYRDHPRRQSILRNLLHVERAATIVPTWSHAYATKNHPTNRH